MNPRPLSSLSKHEVKQRLLSKQKAKSIQSSSEQEKRDLSGLIQVLLYIIVGLLAFAFGGMIALKSYFNF